MNIQWSMKNMLPGRIKNMIPGRIKKYAPWEHKKYALWEHKKYALWEHNSGIKGLAFMKNTSNSVHQLESKVLAANTSYCFVSR